VVKFPASDAAVDGNPDTETDSPVRGSFCSRHAEPGSTPADGQYGNVKPVVFSVDPCCLVFGVAKDDRDGCTLKRTRSQDFPFRLQPLFRTLLIEKWADYVIRCGDMAVRIDQKSCTRTRPGECLDWTSLRRGCGVRGTLAKSGCQFWIFLLPIGEGCGDTHDRSANSVNYLRRLRWRG
jgi:hypothetical protein